MPRTHEDEPSVSQLRPAPVSRRSYMTKMNSRLLVLLLVLGCLETHSNSQTIETIARVLAPGDHVEMTDIGMVESSIDFVVIRHGKRISKLDFLEISVGTPNFATKALFHQGNEVINLVNSKKLLVIDGREVKYFGPILFALEELNESIKGKQGAFHFAMERIQQQKKKSGM